MTGHDFPITPAANFETRKVQDFRVNLGGGSYILINGWGVWDKSAGAWVAQNETITKTGQWVKRGAPGGISIVVPMTFRTKKIADQARSDGMATGYQTI